MLGNQLVGSLIVIYAYVLNNYLDRIGQLLR